MNELVTKSRVMIRACSKEKKNKMFNKPKVKTFEFSNLVEQEHMKDSKSHGDLKI